MIQHNNKKCWVNADVMKSSEQLRYFIYLKDVNTSYNEFYKAVKTTQMN